MTCTATLQQMLDADLDVLAGRGDSPLARHLRHCERCRAVARVLSSESRALAGALLAREPARKPVRRRVTRLLLTPQAGVLATAAAIILFISRLGVHVPPVPVSGNSATTATPPAGRIDPAPVPTGATPRTPAAAGGRRPAAGRTRVPSLGAPIAPSEPIAPTAFVSAPLVATAAEAAHAGRESMRSAAAAASGERALEVVVVPPAGMRAAVLRTSNPNITVVWLY